MAIVRLGNSSAREAYYEDGPTDENGNPTRVRKFSELPGDQVTTIHVPPDRDLSEAFTEITLPERGVWAAHSSDKPTWVESDDKALEYLLSQNWKIPVGEPVPSTEPAQEGAE